MRPSRLFINSLLTLLAFMRDGDVAPGTVPLELPAAGAAFVDVRDATVDWQPEDGGRLSVVTTAKGPYAWVTIPAPAGGFDLGRRAVVEADVVNRGANAVEAQLWVVADRGWESVGDFARLEPGGRRTFSCRLRETFPDGTPKLDPARITGSSVFHTDNDALAVRPVTEAMGVPTEFVASGLGAHSVAMFLDDRASTRRLREWFADLVSREWSGGDAAAGR